MDCPKCKKAMKKIIYADGYAYADFYECSECKIKIEVTKNESK